MISLLLGDMRERLAELPENSVGSCVTDPQYGIEIVGQKWDSPGVCVAWEKETWECLLRVLKPGAVLVAFGHPTTNHRAATAIEKAGFEIFDGWGWVKGGANMPHGGWVSPAIDKHLGATREVIGMRTVSGSAALSTAERGGTHSVGVDSRGRKKDIPVTLDATEDAKKWHGYAYNVRPSFEPIVVARKPFDGSGVASILKWGVGALNVHDCLVGGKRYPPGLMLSKQAALFLGEQSGVTKSSGNKTPTTSKGAFHGASGVKKWDPSQLNKGDTGTAARYFPQFKWNKKSSRFEKSIGGAVLPPWNHEKDEALPWVIASVKPIALIRWLMRLVTPRGEGCIDPFLGSGTGAIAAHFEGYGFTGIELHPSHLMFAEMRLAAAMHAQGAVLRRLAA